MFKKVFGPAMVILLSLAGSATGALARHRHHSSDAAPGEFDYYVLSLSWSPAFCLDSPRSSECNGARRYGFIVHGLWPQNERGWPANCAGNTRVPDDVVRAIADLMPARALVYHEWASHGTCSGLDPAAYFALVRRAHDTVAIPTMYSRPLDATEQSPASIAAEFLQANARLPPHSVAVTCSGQSAPRLREVHVCFSRDMTPRACSAGALRETCSAIKVIVPPIR
ncbi:MAG: ribonuclease [Gammaproteobacteria bacterium]|nr:ribonuclease [Gammaproteobacteria bacterium]